MVNVQQMVYFQRKYQILLSQYLFLTLGFLTFFFLQRK